VLCRDSKARKISRYEVELTLNQDHRKTYILMQVDLAEAPAKQGNFSCILDDWIEAINQVVEYLKLVKTTTRRAAAPAASASSARSSRQ